MYKRLLLAVLSVLLLLGTLVLATGCDAAGSDASTDDAAASLPASDPVSLIPYGVDGFLSWNRSGPIRILSSDGSVSAELSVPGFLPVTGIGAASSPSAAVLMAPVDPGEQQWILCVIAGEGDSAKVLPIVDVPLAALVTARLAIAADGSRAAVAYMPSSESPAPAGTACLEVYSVDGTLSWSVASDPAHPLSAWAVDGTLTTAAILRTDYGDGTTTLELFRDGTLAVTMPLASPGAAALSPDGAQLVLSTDSAGGTDIRALEVGDGMAESWSLSVPTVSALYFDSTGTRVIAYGLSGEKTYAGERELSEVFIAQACVIDQSGTVIWSETRRSTVPWMVSMWPFARGFGFFSASHDGGPALAVDLRGRSVTQSETDDGYVNIGVSRDGTSVLGLERSGGLRSISVR